MPCCRTSARSISRSRRRKRRQRPFWLAERDCVVCEGGGLQGGEKPAIRHSGSRRKTMYLNAVNSRFTAFKSNNYFFFLFTASLNDLPAENFTVVAAAILISSPVCGLRPVRAARLPVEKEPKPTSCTVSPLVTALMMFSTTESRARCAAAFEISVSAAIASTNSDLFTLKFLSLLRCRDFSIGMRLLRKPHLMFN